LQRDLRRGAKGRSAANESRARGFSSSRPDSSQRRRVHVGSDGIPRKIAAEDAVARRPPQRQRVAAYARSRPFRQARRRNGAATAHDNFEEASSGQHRRVQMSRMRQDIQPRRFTRRTPQPGSRRFRHEQSTPQKRGTRDCSSQWNPPSSRIHRAAPERRGGNHGSARRSAGRRIQH